MKILIQKFDSLIQLINQALILIRENKNIWQIEEPAVYLNVDEAAILCKVDKRTIYRWRLAGLVCPVRIGGSIFFEKKALMLAIKENMLSTKRIPCGC